MAINNWKRAKSGESKSYPLVYRNKTDGDDVVAIRIPVSYSSSTKYYIERNDEVIDAVGKKDDAIKILKRYLETHS